jgi:hypothetical protein
MDFGYCAPEQQPMLFPGTVAGTVLSVGEGAKVDVGQKVRPRPCPPEQTGRVD